MNNSSFWEGGTIPWVSSGDMKQPILRSTMKSVTPSAITETSTPLLPPDAVVVVTRSGILRKYLPVALTARQMAINQDLKALIPQPGVHPAFVLHSLIAHGPQILARCLKSGTTVESIEFGWLKGFEIPLPQEEAEQCAIATALSDADALIASMERLIAKKQAIKQGAMQALLTPPGQPGHKRLPGFKGKWEVKSIDQFAEIDPENLVGTTRPAYEFNYIALEDVVLGTLRTHSRQIFGAAPSRARRVLRRGDILMATVRPTLLSHFMFDRDGSDWICSTGFSVIRCNDRLADSGYVFHHLFHRSIGDQIDALITGSNYPAINRKDVAALNIPMPPPSEQAAISTVLNDMTHEIAATESKLEKLRLLKQGMMQELLTGRTRLV